jgi:secreted trypsin-like serine protease
MPMQILGKSFLDIALSGIIYRSLFHGRQLSGAENSDESQIRLRDSQNALLKPPQYVS